MEINKNVQDKFEAISGLKLHVIQNSSYNIKLATFDKFSVNDEINLKLLAVQGVNVEYVKLQSAKKTQEGQKVFMFMVKNNKIKSFYSCYVEKTATKLPKVKAEDVSVTPLRSDNTRQDKQQIQTEYVSKADYDLLNQKLDFLLQSIVEQKTTAKQENKKGLFSKK